VLNNIIAGLCYPWFARCSFDFNCRGSEMDDYRQFGSAEKEAVAVAPVTARTARVVGSGSPPHTTIVSANCYICELKENTQPSFKCATCQRTYHFACLQVYGELPTDFSVAITCTSCKCASLVNQSIDIFSPLDSKWYPTLVISFDRETVEHTIQFEDEDVERTIELANHLYRTRDGVAVNPVVRPRLPAPPPPQPLLPQQHGIGANAVPMNGVGYQLQQQHGVRRTAESQHQTPLTQTVGMVAVTVAESHPVAGRPAAREKVDMITGVRAAKKDSNDADTDGDEDYDYLDGHSSDLMFPSGAGTDVVVDMGTFKDAALGSHGDSDDFVDYSDDAHVDYASENPLDCSGENPDCFDWFDYSGENAGAGAGAVFHQHASSALAFT
jgi:hypothetical protein